MISTYIIPSNFTLAAGATANIDVRLSDISDMKVFVDQQWGSISSTTGIDLFLYPGWGGVDPNEVPGAPIPYVLSNPASSNKSSIPQFAGNYQDASPNLVTPTVSSSTTSSAFYLSTVIETWPNWIRMQCINLDATYPVGIKVLASI